MGIAPEMGRAYLCSVKKKGFRETTTRDIAREAGINLSNLYHLSMVISGISQLLALAPFLYIWAPPRPA